MASEVSSGTTTNHGGEEKTRLELPLGFRFYPSDEELISHYLTRKLNSSFSCLASIDVDLNKMEPWDLPCNAMRGEKEWYFFCHKDRKYPTTGLRTNRATGSGYWKATGKDKEIVRGHRVLVGMRKTLVHYTGRAPIEHQTGVDVSTGDMRIAADDGRLGEGDQDEPGQFRCPHIFIPPARRRLLLELWKNQWDPAHDDGFNMATPKEEDSLHCSVRAPKPSVRFSASDVLHNKMPWATHLEIMQGIASSAPEYLRSSLDRPIVHLDLKPSNVLLDEKTENQLSDFGMSRLLHANDYTQIPMGSAVPTHNGPLDAKFSGKPSAERGIEIKIGSHMTHRRTYLSVHHHPVMQILPSARKWITSKRTFGDIFKGWISAKPKYESFGVIFMGWISEKPKYETPNAGPVSECIIRKLFGIKNGLTVNGSQQHSEPDSCRSGHGKMVNTNTEASWIVATAAPHHATGNRSLLSGFIMEHDDQFVHAVNRVPMKVLARGAVVTDALILPDVWFVPGLTENLVSVSQLAELDHSIGFGRGECCIRCARDAKIVGKGRLQKGGHYVLDYLKVPLAI